MKKNYIAITLGLALGATAVAGCGTAKSTDTSATEEAQTVYGEITEIGEDSITIKVGTQKEAQETKEASASDTSDSSNDSDNASDTTTSDTDATSSDTTDEKTDAKSSDTTDEKTDVTSSDAKDATDSSDSNVDTSDSKNSDTSDSSNNSDKQNGNGAPGEAPSMLDYTGEELTVTINDDTEITKDTSHGGMGQSTPPEMPSGGAPGSNSDGKGASDGQSTPPEKPDGDTSDSNSSSDGQSTPPAKPDGDTSDNNSSSDGQSTPPAKPDGDSTDNNSGNSGEQNGSNQESSDQNSQSGSTDSSDAKSSDSSQNADSNSTSDSDQNSDSNSTSDSDQKSDNSNSESEDIDFDDLAVGDIVEISYDADGDVVTVTVLMSENGMGQPGGGASNGVDSYDAVNEYSEDTTVDGETISSTGTDENAIHVTDGAKVSIKNSKITRTSSDSTGGDNSSFYGVGAAVLTTDGTSYISNTTVDTDAAGAAGIFAYGDGVVYAADSTITTTQDTSGGIHAAGGGTLYAWDLTAETSGNSSAAIRSDRGGGTMVVDGGTYTSNGTGSPAIYSTADITVNDATLTANGSEAICIEGLNSIRLFDCDLTGNMGDDSQNDCTWNVILYQSMSGDSEVGNSTFEMNGGTLTAKNGGMFYTTNTESTITLSNVDITNADDSEFFLRCTGNNNQRGWGQNGSNGADCLFTAIDQEMSGNVIWDSISQLDFYMTDGSTLTGAVQDDETYAGNGGSGYCNFYIEKGSKWVVTGDSTLTNLYNAETIVDASGNTVTIKGTDGTVYVKGTSSYTITVDSYETSVDLSGASTTSSWSDYEVAKPAELS